MSKAFAKSKYTTSTPVFSCRDSAIEFVKDSRFVVHDLSFKKPCWRGSILDSVRFYSSSYKMRSKTFMTKLISEIGR